MTKKYDNSLKMLKQFNILVVEDCTITANLLEVMLKEHFKTVYVSTNGLIGKNIFDKCDIDIVLTDIHMPVCNGIELVKHIRFHDKEIPIIVMTAEDDILTLKKLISLKLSDYILKPILDGELLFRIVNSMKEKMTSVYQSIQIAGGSVFDRNTSIVSKNGVNINLTKRELQLLVCLSEHLNTCVTSYDIMADIWGSDESSNSTLRGLIKTLRTKLGDVAIVAVSNRGYMLHGENK